MTINSLGPAGMSMAGPPGRLETSLFGFGDPGIAGPADFVDFRNRASPEGQSGDGLRSADGPYSLDPGELGCECDQRVKSAPRPGRGHGDDLGHAGRPGWDCQHHQRGEERGLPARNVEPNAVDRPPGLVTLRPGAVSIVKSLGRLAS